MLAWISWLYRQFNTLEAEGSIPSASKFFLFFIKFKTNEMRSKVENPGK